MSSWPIKYTPGSLPAKAKRKNQEKDIKKRRRETVKMWNIRKRQKGKPRKNFSVRR